MTPARPGTNLPPRRLRTTDPFALDGKEGRARRQASRCCPQRLACATAASSCAVSPRTAHLTHFHAAAYAAAALVAIATAFLRLLPLAYPINHPTPPLSLSHLNTAHFFHCRLTHAFTCRDSKRRDGTRRRAVWRFPTEQPSRHHRAPHSRRVAALRSLAYPASSGV